MATTASLIVEVKANIASLTSGLGKASSMIAKFASSAVSTFLNIGKKIALGLTGAVAAIGYILNKTADDIDSLQETAQSLGLLTSELQKLQYQAALAGQSNESLVKSFEFMQNNIEEATEGSEKMQAAFEKLGLNAELLKMLKPEQQFQQIASAFKGIGSSAERINLAKTIFGKGGVQALKTFNSNLAQSGAEFDKLGIAITEKQASAVSAFTDAKDKLAEIWTGFKVQIVSAISPVFTAILSYISDSIVKFGGLKKVALEVALGIGNGVATVIGFFIKLGSKLDEIILKFKEVELFALKAQKLTSSSLSKEDLDKKMRRGTATEEDFGKFNTGLLENDQIAAKQREIESIKDRIANPQPTPTMNFMTGLQDALKSPLMNLENQARFQGINDGTNSATIFSNSGRNSFSDRPEQDVNVTITIKDGKIIDLVNATVDKNTNKQMDKTARGVAK